MHVGFSLKHSCLVDCLYCLVDDTHAYYYIDPLKQSFVFRFTMILSLFCSNMDENGKTYGIILLSLIKG